MPDAGDMNPKERAGKTLPRFAPVFDGFWQLCLPGAPSIVYYIPEREALV